MFPRCNRVFAASILALAAGSVPRVATAYDVRAVKKSALDQSACIGPL